MASSSRPSRHSLILLFAFLQLLPSLAEAQTKRVTLEVLVLSARDLGTRMIKEGFDEGLIPYTEIDLTYPARPTIDEAFLVDTATPSVRRARYQAVVLPDESPADLGPSERAALARFEREFAIRQLDAYVYPSAAVQLRSVRDGGFSGVLDGLTASLTDAARARGFGYLKGPIPLEDLDPRVCETYGHLALPLPASDARGRAFVPLVTAPIPGGRESGVLMGVLEDDGREEMVLTAALNHYQVAQQALFPGLVNWLTHGVHLGTEQNYLTVHIDDVFLPDSRWIPELDCTSSGDCPLGVKAADILMTPADVEYLVAWQARSQIMLDMVFNGLGYDAMIESHGRYPLGDALLAHKDQLRWVSHTYSHLYLGCIQDYSVKPWRCVSDEHAGVSWTPYDTVYEELTANLDFARRVGIKVDREELVTGEHSGLRRTPYEPSDNPNLSAALNSLGVDWIGSDNSRDDSQRPLGATLTVPRFPLNVFYNVGTEREEIDEYNWIYTTPADGGSGICLVDPKSTCITPLDPVRGFDTYILPQQVRSLLLHMLSNSPRPHYAHQSNLAEDRLLYPVIDGALEAYHSIFNDDIPIINATMAELGAEMRLRNAWHDTRGKVTAYVEGGALVLTSSKNVLVPLTAPASSLRPSFTRAGAARTGWQSVRPSASIRIGLPDSVAYAR